MCWGSSICCLLEMRIVNHIALILLIIPDGHNALSGSNLWVVLISHLHTFYLPDHGRPCDFGCVTVSKTLRWTHFDTYCLSLQKA